MAQEAVKQTDGYRLDKNHTFAVSLMSEFDRYDRKKDFKKSLYQFFL
jgi:hypothetical protein